MRKNYLFISLLFINLSSVAQANGEIPIDEDVTYSYHRISAPFTIPDKDYKRLMRGKKAVKMDSRWFSSNFGASVRFSSDVQRIRLLEPLVLTKIKVYKRTWPMGGGEEEFYQQCTYYNHTTITLTDGREITSDGEFTLETTLAPEEYQ